MTTPAERLKAVFDQAAEIASPADRAAFLDEACGGDADLRARVEALLRAHAEAGSFLNRPAIALGATGTFEPTPEAETTAHSQELVGTQIGPYKLLQQIGEGGMGTVFMAEQTEPVKRKVALKVIKAGMDSRQVIARFEAERQALAMMDHVNIARVFDGGTTENGRPYFVMELVHGVPITKYCDDNHLTPRQRLELFVPVCQAIQHAHQKGIIHRDIKPSNVMVTLYDGKPVPKVIDFGVAKATEQKLTERTLFTQYGTMVGTPQYMSPEQAEMSALGVDTRSDIYSLGVLLYELLTGSTPLTHKRMKEAAYGEILRMIKEEEPPKPSTRLSDSGEALASISAQRNTEPAKLSKLMRGELDWIVMKCLEKDRNRRYETANGFAMDVQRYLTDEPVQACPPSARYRLRKFVRRNKGPAVAASLVTAVLLVGIVGTTWGMVQAERRRMEAEMARSAEAEQREQAVANLYDSLVGEARALRLARVTGYREQVWQRLRQAARLDTPKRDPDQLRREAAACLGDFVGLEPTVIKELGKGRIRTIALHPRAPQMALVFTDGTLSVRRLPDGAETARWTGHPGAVIHTVAFDPEGKALASGAADGSIVLWEPSAEGGWTRKWTHAIEPVAPGIIDKAMTVVFTPDGKQLAACSAGGSAIQFWNAPDGRPMARFEARDSLSGSLAMSPDGKLLAAGYYGNDEHGIRVWDVATGKVIQDLLPGLAKLMDLRFSFDGKLLACGCEAGMAVFDLSTFQRRLFFLGGNIYAVAFSPDSQLLACATQGSTRLWDVVTNREVATLVQPRAPEEDTWSDFVYSMALTRDGKTIVSASKRRIVLWDTAGAPERLLLKRFAGGIPGVAFSPQGDLLASISQDRTVTLWNPVTGQLVRSLTGCQGALQAVAFSPDGRLLATGDFSGREAVRIWDVESGQSLAALDPKLGDVWSVAFSLDGQYFAAGGDRGWVLWKIVPDRANGKVGTGPLLQVMTRREITMGVGCLCFTPDGSLLAWVEKNRTFHLWDLAASHERQSPVSDLGAYVLSIGHYVSPFGPKRRGNWLWLGRPEGGEIWDMTAGEKVDAEFLIRDVEVLPAELRLGWSQAISPDGNWWAVGHAHGSLVLWDLAKIRARLEEAGLGWETGKR